MFFLVLGAPGTVIFSAAVPNMSEKWRVCRPEMMFIPGMEGFEDTSCTPVKMRVGPKYINDTFQRSFKALVSCTAFSVLFVVLLVFLFQLSWDNSNLSPKRSRI